MLVKIRPNHRFRASRRCLRDWYVTATGRVPAGWKIGRPVIVPVKELPGIIGRLTWRFPK